MEEKNTITPEETTSETSENCGCEEKKEHGCHSHDHENCECKKEEHKKNKKEKLVEEIETLKEANKELENKLLVSRADFINYRKRKDEEMSRLIKYSKEDMIKELLPTVDNFERAIALDNEDLDDELSKFLEGFKMIYCNLVGVLEKYEVKAIDGNNKLFDPAYHQAVMTSKIEGMEPGMVIEVLQKGYMYKDRVIRPAMVRVSE